MHALDVCASKIERHKVSRARHIATEACRRACNGDDFLAMVKQRTGLCFEVIPPSEEARLALASCENLLDPEIPYGLLIDIGGGSTEVSWIRVSHRADRLGGVATELLDMTSVPWGVVTLTESCVKGQPREQPVTRACYDDMVERIRADLRPFCAKHEIGKAIARGEVQMVGASGTVTTVSAHHLGLKRYNRTLVDGSRIGRDSILRICDQLSVKSVVELTDMPCIGNDRADLALAGGAILEAVCRQWHAPMVRVADRGLREGVLMDLMRQADREADPFRCRDDVNPASPTGPATRHRAGEDRARPHGLLAALAAAPAQRPLRRRGQEARLPLARGLQAPADRRPVPFPEARRPRRRSRRRTGRLDPGRGRAREARPRSRKGGGVVIGIDITPIEPIAGATVLAKDFYDDDAPAVLEELLGGPADVVLSDMAAAATGETQVDHLRIMGLAEAAHDFACQVLKPGGSFVAKVLRGGTERTLLDRLKRDFVKVRHVKPEASRANSAEMYVVGTGFRG